MKMTNFVQLPSFRGVAENPVAMSSNQDVRAALQRRRRVLDVRQEYSDEER